MSAFILIVLLRVSYADQLSGIPKYSHPEQYSSIHKIKDSSLNGINISDFHNSGRRRGVTLGISRGLSISDFHNSGRRRGVTLGISRGLSISDFHNSGRRRGITLGISRGLNISGFHNSGRRRGITLGVSRDLNVSNSYYSGTNHNLTSRLNHRDRSKRTINAELKQSEKYALRIPENSYIFQNINTKCVINPLSDAKLFKTDKLHNTKKKIKSVNINNSEIPYITLIAPENVGLTSIPQPSLFWYISASYNGLVEFTLNEVGTLNPISVLYILIEGVTEKGIYKFDLEYFDILLKENLEYEYHLALVINELERSNDISVSAVIKYVKATNISNRRLTNTSDNKLYYVYADVGYWYDAFENLQNQINMGLSDTILKSHRKELLKQVNLPLVSDYLD